MSAVAVLVALAASNGSPLRNAFLDTIEVMKMPGVEVLPEVMPCGQVNAAYVPATHQLIMCAETLELGPDIVTAITAHEMAHAIIDQYNIPVPGSEETAADELSAVALGMTDQTIVILRMGVFFAQHPQPFEDVWDDHPSNARRAATLMCLGDGAEPDALLVECRRKFLRAQMNWMRLIAAFGPHSTAEVSPE